MSNLLKKSVKSEIKISDIGDMIKMVRISYPEISSSNELALKISENFNVICTERDILEYEAMLKAPPIIISEDYELENRKQEYGINY